VAGEPADGAHLAEPVRSRWAGGAERPATPADEPPHQLSGELEAMVRESRRWKPYWGPRRLVRELARRQVGPLPSASAVYRCLVRARVIDPVHRYRRLERLEPERRRCDPPRCGCVRRLSGTRRPGGVPSSARLGQEPPETASDDVRHAQVEQGDARERPNLERVHLPMHEPDPEAAQAKGGQLTPHVDAVGTGAARAHPGFRSRSSRRRRWRSALEMPRAEIAETTAHALGWVGAPAGWSAAEQPARVETRWGSRLRPQLRFHRPLLVRRVDAATAVASLTGPTHGSGGRLPRHRRYLGRGRRVSALPYARPSPEPNRALTGRSRRR
jgi:hypothetical protein